MKKYSTIFVASVMALVSCQKEAVPANEALTSADKVYTYVIGVSNPGDADDHGSKLTVDTATQTSVTAKWEAGDVIGIADESGAIVGSGTLDSGEEGKQSGKFTVTATATPGTSVRVIYPYDAQSGTYGAGKLASEQEIKSATSGVLGNTSAYSELVTLVEGQTIKAKLSYALANVKFRFKADKNGIFNYATNGWMDKILIRTLDGTPLSGGFAVNPAEGTVIATGENSDFVRVSRGAGFNINDYSFAYLTALPTAKETIFEIRMSIRNPQGDASYEVPILFKGKLEAGKMNYFDLGEVSMSPEYMPTGHDYYAKWLAGEDIVIDDNGGHELVVNKTNFPTATLLRASQVKENDYSALKQGLVFIDETDATLNFQPEPTANQIDLLATNGELVCIGRWKDWGCQPNLKIKEVRAKKCNMSFVNVKMTCMRSSNSNGGGNMFSTISSISANVSVRLKDCWLDARGAQRVFDLMQSASGYALDYVYVDNCIVDLPERSFNSGEDVRGARMSMFTITKTPYDGAINCIVRNSNLFTSNKSVYYQNGKGNRQEFLIDFNSKKCANASFEFTNNTIANICNPYGLCYFNAATCGTLKFNSNLGAIEYITPAEGATSTMMTRCQSSTVTNVEIQGNVGFSRGVEGNNNYLTLHTSNPFTGEGVKDNATKTYIDTPFIKADYSNGVFELDIKKLDTTGGTIVRAGAGARTAKKYVTASFDE